MPPTAIQKVALRGLCQLAFSFKKALEVVQILPNSQLRTFLLAEYEGMQTLEHIPLLRGRIFKIYQHYFQ